MCYLREGLRLPVRRLRSVRSLLVRVAGQGLGIVGRRVPRRCCILVVRGRGRVVFLSRVLLRFGGLDLLSSLFALVFPCVLSRVDPIVVDRVYHSGTGATGIPLR